MAIHHDRTTADIHHITLYPMKRLQFIISIFRLGANVMLIEHNNNVITVDTMMPSYKIIYNTYTPGICRFQPCFACFFAFCRQVTQI